MIEKLIVNSKALKKILLTLGWMHGWEGVSRDKSRSLWECPHFSEFLWLIISFLFSFFFPLHIYLNWTKGSWGRVRHILGPLVFTCSSFFHAFIMGDSILKIFSGICLCLWDLDLHLSALSCFTHTWKDLNHLKSWGLDPLIQPLPPDQLDISSMC